MIDILIAGSMDILLAMGALVSDCAGIMAVFLEGVINLGAFLCFAFSVFTGSVHVGMLLSVVSCTAFILSVAFFTEKFSAQPIVVGLAVNIFSMGFIAFFSSIWFETKGTLSPLPQPSMHFFAHEGAAIITFVFAIVLTIALQKTRWGLRTRIVGSDAVFLISRGINVKKYRIISWCIAAFFAAMVGCILVLRLQAFVPNVSAGKGWLALVAVFFGKKKTLPTILAALFFAAIAYGANRLQALHLVPHTVLLAFPNIAALLLFIAMPQRNKS